MIFDKKVEKKLSNALANISDGDKLNIINLYTGLLTLHSHELAILRSLINSAPERAIEVLTQILADREAKFRKNPNL